MLTSSFALNSSNLLSFALEVVGHEREAEVEDADKCKQDSENFYESFVLHFE